MHLTEGNVGASARTISARTANGQVIMPENALTWQSVTIVVFQGTLLRNAARNHCVGTVESPVTWPETVQMRASATLAARQGTVLETAQLPQCHLAT